jgi:hypothetical protein
VTPDCGLWQEQIVESARRGAEPREALAAHLRSCPDCRALWSEQRKLSTAMAGLREALDRERSPESRRRQLMAAFAQSDCSRPQRPAWWAWSPAAALVAMALVLLFAGARHDPASPETAAADGFVEVPYAQPLAPGEPVWIERREVDGAELGYLGIDVPAAYGGSVAADILLGEDGLPRAVRLAAYEEF